MADTKLPDMPEDLSNDDVSRWLILAERYNRMDLDIRGQESLAAAAPPPWLNRRRAERAALAWAMGLVAKHHDCTAGEG